MKDIIAEKQIDKPIIEVRNIGKKYSINHERGRYVALRDVLAGIAKKPFSFLKKKARSAIGLEKREEFWALKGVNFNIKKGEVVGVIGNNGAGKSTLLKILSQITPPTEGEIILRGKVGSLLEVGTGFHPELTGRENIFLNGAILGMERKEISEKFDKIVEFSGVEKFLDTPVKYYSSGMYVRLAFSVAAHMEPDILLVDEVLAVGDAEFQKKCLGKMNEITQQDGRTILFVSHNMVAIQNLCQKTVLMEGGRVKMYDYTDKVIEYYLNKSYSEDSAPISSRKDRTGDNRLKIKDYKLLNKSGEKTSSFISGEDCELWIEYEIKDPGLKEVDVSIGIDSLPSSHRVALISSQVTKKKIKIDPKNKFIKISLKKLPLNAGNYQFTIFIDENGKIIDWVKAAGNFMVNPGFFYASGKLPSQGTVLVDYDFN